MMALTQVRNEQDQAQEGWNEGGLDLGPLAFVLSVAPAGRVVPARYAFWARSAARRQVRALADAMAEVAGRVEAEPGSAARRAEVRRRQRLERARAAALAEGLTPPPLTPAEVAQAERLAQRLAKVKKGERGAPVARAQVAQGLKAIEATRAERVRAREDEVRRTETVRLEALRAGVGEAEVVDRPRGDPRIRLRTRDGLKLLHERGAFGHDRIEAASLLAYGLRYRDLVELAQAALKSCLDMTERGRRSLSLWEQAGRAQRRAATANQVRRIEAAVAARCGPEALEVLRAVAGEARSVSEMPGGRRRHVSLTAHLVEALRVTGDVLTKGA